MSPATAPLHVPASGAGARRPRPSAAGRLGAVLAVVLAALVALAAPAGAHVTSEEQPPAAAGEPTPLTFSFDHGCNGQPTTSLRVQIPDGVRDVRPESPAGWTATVLDGEVRWDGGSVPDGERATFSALVTIDQPEGTVVRFPTIQGCPTAESAWIQIPDAANPEPDYPAPQIVVGAATDAVVASEPSEDAGASTTVAGATATTVTRQPLEATPVTETGAERNNVGLVVLAVVVLVIVGGAVILYLRHRRPRTPSA